MWNPFSSVVDSVKAKTGNWLKKNQSVVGIDLGSSTVKVVQVSKKEGRLILETYGEIACGPYAGLGIGQAALLSTEKMSELLQDLFKEANVTAALGAFAIPLRSSLLLNIELPAVDGTDLNKVVPLEARKYIPVPISEVALDYWVIPELASSMNDDSKNHPTQEVLIAATHRDVMKQFDDVALGAGFTNQSYEIETFGTIRSVLQNDLAPTVVIDLGAITTKVVVVDYGIVRSSHTINKGGQDITTAVSRSYGISFSKAEEIKRKVGFLSELGEKEIISSISPVVEYIFSDVSRVVLQYQKKYGRVIDRVVLVGGGAMLRGLPEVAQKMIEAPIVIGTPFDRLEAPAFLEDVLKAAGPGFSASVGTAMRAAQSL